MKGCLTVKLGSHSSENRYAVVDVRDYDELNRYRWHALSSGHHIYAARVTREDGKQRVLLMHREILGAKTGERVEHINGDTLDNRQENLRARRCGKKNGT